jgi:DNA-binding transcriptional LysR family regulator
MGPTSSGINALLTLKSSPGGTVRLSCPVTASHTLLALVVAGFLQRCPEFTLRVQVTNRVIDLFENDVEIPLARSIICR